MILFPLLTSCIWLQVLISARLPLWKPALISDARQKAKQGRPGNGNPIQ